MQTNQNSTGGYIRLVVLLISIALIAFFLLRTNLFNGQKGSKNMLEQGQEDIQKAKAVKGVVEENSRGSFEAGIGE